jgi:hypothetical protein
MACKITDGVIAALPRCQLKAFYKLSAEVGSRCGYESLLVEQRANAPRRAIEKIRRDYSETDVATDVDLSVANLRKGVGFIFGARLDDEHYTVVFDALRKTEGPSTLGDFRYQPVTFSEVRKVRASDRQQHAARDYSGADSGGAS